jgi:hypothetical protein
VEFGQGCRSAVGAVTDERGAMVELTEKHAPVSLRPPRM